jgi:hypothetical protein
MFSISQYGPPELRAGLLVVDKITTAEMKRPRKTAGASTPAKKRRKLSAAISGAGLDSERIFNLDPPDEVAASEEGAVGVVPLSRCSNVNCHAVSSRTVKDGNARRADPQRTALRHTPTMRLVEWF